MSKDGPNRGFWTYGQPNREAGWSKMFGYFLNERCTTLKNVAVVTSNEKTLGSLAAEGALRISCTRQLGLSSLPAESWAVLVVLYVTRCAMLSDALGTSRTSSTCFAFTTIWRSYGVFYTKVVNLNIAVDHSWSSFQALEKHPTGP